MTRRGKRGKAARQGKPCGRQPVPPLARSTSGGCKQLCKRGRGRAGGPPRRRRPSVGGVGGCAQSARGGRVRNGPCCSSCIPFFHAATAALSREGEATGRMKGPAREGKEPMAHLTIEH